jgi:hypothetical protein
MRARVTVTTTYRCTLERAFKTPILCDVAEVHTGFGPMPRVTHCEDDADWGRVGSKKRVFVARSWTQPGGEASSDTVVERVENERWTIEVGDFQAWMLGFTRFVGEWKTTPVAEGEVRVDYTYTLHAGAPWLYPLQWLFAYVFWPRYMRQVLENIRGMIARGSPYRHA